MKEAQIKDPRLMEKVNESIKFINEKFEEMELDRKEKEREILELKNEVKTLSEEVETMDNSLDHYKQYCRRNCSIDSIKESEEENTDKVVIETFEKVSASDIVRSHQIGKNIPGVDLGLLSLNLLGTMSVMQYLGRKNLEKSVVSITEPDQKENN